MSLSLLAELQTQASVLGAIPAVGRQILEGVDRWGYTLLICAWALPLAGLIYAVLLLGQMFAPRCEWREDEHVGLKAMLGGLLLLGTGLLANGVQGLLFLFVTFNDFGAGLERAVPDLIVGFAVVSAVLLVGIPSSNHEDYPQAMRMSAGAVTMSGAVGTVLGAERLFAEIFAFDGWPPIADAGASFITALLTVLIAGYAYAGLTKLDGSDLRLGLGLSRGPQRVQSAPTPSPRPQTGAPPSAAPDLAPTVSVPTSAQAQASGVQGTGRPASTLRGPPGGPSAR